MPAFTATAPAKIILFGEHAVVYGQPAVAVPVSSVRARAVVRANLDPGRAKMHISAPDIDLDADVQDLAQDHPLRVAVQALLTELNIPSPPPCSIQLTSTIPVASGLGSSAAVSVALIRAVAGFMGHPLPDEKVSALAYEAEKVHHGTPSGIDNTVVTYAKPVYYQKGQGAEIVHIKKAFNLLIGDTGHPSSTAETVRHVRDAHHKDPDRFEGLFRGIGTLTDQARTALEEGNPLALGPLMDDNHALLQEMGVSSRRLDELVQLARQAGALGAKLSGGGRGGNMIALVREGEAEHIAHSLKVEGAAKTILTRVQPS